MLYKNFAIFKTKANDNPKAPSHRINMKIGEEFVEIGACWTKETSKGDKFLSCKLSDVYVNEADRTKSKKGYGIKEEDVDD